MCFRNILVRSPRGGNRNRYAKVALLAPIKKRRLYRNKPAKITTDERILTDKSRKVALAQETHRRHPGMI
jgi:hypothetical protein